MGNPPHVPKALQEKGSAEAWKAMRDAVGFYCRMSPPHALRPRFLTPPRSISLPSTSAQSSQGAQR